MTFPPVACQVVLLLVVIVAGVYDYRYRRIPNWSVLVGLIFGFALNMFLAPSAWEGLLTSLKGMGVAFLIYFPMYILRGMGAGDVKLMAAIGSIVGFANWIGIFLITAILGGVVAVLLLLSRHRLQHGLANVGFLISQLLVFRAPYAHREELDIKSEKSMKLPHGVVIAWGSVLFLGAAWIWAPR